MSSRLLFLLDYEPDFDFVTQDSIIAKQQLDKRKDLYRYVVMKESDFYDSETGELKTAADFPPEFRKAYPIGSLEFIESFLKIFHGIDREPAIEVPEQLQTIEFLKRDYKIVPFSSLPKDGCFFIKDASNQKSFSYCGNIAELQCELPGTLDESHLYVVSDLLDIVSEYRVYVIRGEIKAVSFYKGNPLAFPDTAFIKKTVRAYSRTANPLASYSFDVMITEKGTALIEMHSFLSLGLYWTKWDE